MSTGHPPQAQAKALVLALALALVLVCSVAGKGAPDDEITQVIADDGLLLQIGSNNYALSGAKLRGCGYLGASINGDQVELLKAPANSGDECRRVVKKWAALDGAERSAIELGRGELLQLAGRQQSDSAKGPDTPRPRSWLVAKFGLRQAGCTIGSSSGIASSIQTRADVSLVRQDERRYSIGSDLARSRGFGRVFFHEDLVAYARSNGQVSMRPAACLSRDEHLLNEQLIESTGGAGGGTGKANFLEKMSESERKKLEKKMEKLDAKMRKMFTAGFPLGSF